MLSEFEKYIGFKILKYFLFNPKSQIHLKEIARTLKISSSITKFYCDLLLNDNILNITKKGNLRIFFLNNDSIYVKELKKVFLLIYFKENGIDKLINKGSLSIYGSYASGNFDEKSDLDIIIIGNEPDVDKDNILNFENKINKQIQLTVIPYYKWEKMKQQKDPFALEVLSNNIIIKGAEL